MNVRRNEFVSEIKRLKLEIAEVDRRLSELGELANPTSSPPAASASSFATDYPGSDTVLRDARGRAVGTVNRGHK